MPTYRLRVERCKHTYMVSNYDSKRMTEDNSQVKHPAVAVPVSKEADETSRNTCERINGDSE